MLGMSQILFIVGAVPFGLLGIAHLTLTLADLSRPRSFVPTDASVIPVLEQTSVVMTANAPGGRSMWQTWLGANLTHSIGLLGFASLVLMIAVQGGDSLSALPALAPVIVVIGLAYTVAALRFWFLPAALAAAVGTGLFLVAGVV
jgi:hypothetical protein